MGNGSQFFRYLSQSSDLSGSRSTVLKPLTWFLSILLGGFIGLIYFNAPIWILIFYVIIISLAIIIFLFTYLFCLFNDRDALRSERYSIQKMAIQKGLLGDNLIGVIDIEEQEKENKFLSPTTNLDTQKEEGEDL